MKFISHVNEFTWGVRTHTKQLNKSHTHTTKTKGTRREVQSRSKLKKKKKKKKKKEEEREAARQNRRRKAGGNGQQHEKTTSEDGVVSFLLLNFSIFFKFLVPPDFHFSAEMSDIQWYVQYSPVRTIILSSTNQGCVPINIKKKSSL